jgi:hypothetical protein
MATKFASRKFVLAAGALIALTVLCWFGKIDGGQFVTGLLGTVGAYVTANVMQKKNGA